MYYYNAAALFCQINDKKNRIFELIGSHNVFQNTMSFAKPNFRFGQKGLDIFIFHYLFSDRVKDSIFTNKIEQKFFIWRFDGLVEYNAHPINYQYDTIQIISSGLYNEHSFECKFYKNRIMYFQNSTLNIEKKKKTHKLNKQEFQTFTSIMNYGDFQSDTTFDAGFTDSNWIQTDLTLSNGKKITILDRGMEKSLILRRFYQFIDQMKSKYFTSK